jgi:hypothetical protein
MTITYRPHKRRLRLIAVLVTVVALVVAAIVYVVGRIPDYRTAFLIDTSTGSSDSDFSALANAVSSAAQNVGDHDALSLRRFSGACGDDPHNTTQIVSSGTNHGQQIGDAVHTITPGGDPTLQSGIFAAIDDFSSFYPFRGQKSNRIVVVTSHGTDACIQDQTALTKKIRDRIDAARLQLEFRFVGYKVPTDQQGTLTQIAAASGAPQPRFVQTAADLAATLKELMIPESPYAAPINVPSPSVSTEVPSPSISTPRPPTSQPAAKESPQTPPWLFIAGVWWKDGKKSTGDSFSFDGKEARWVAKEASDPLAGCEGIITDLNSSTQVTMKCKIGNNADDLTIRDVTVSLSVSGNVLTIRGDPLLEGTYEDVDGTNPLRPR